MQTNLWPLWPTIQPGMKLQQSQLLGMLLVKNKIETCYQVII